MLFEKIASIIRGVWLRSIVNIFHKGSHINKGFRIGKNCQLRFRGKGRIIIGDNVVIGNNVKLSVLKNGLIELQDEVGINDYCQLVAHEGIIIGYKTNIAPFTCFFDHDHVFKKGIIKKEYIVSSITVGHSCWIGANTVILRNTKIGDCCLIGAGAVIKGTVPNDTIVIQKRNTLVKESEGL